MDIIINIDNSKDNIHGKSRTKNSNIIGKLVPLNMYSESRNIHILIKMYSKKISQFNIPHHIAERNIIYLYAKQIINIIIYTILIVVFILENSYAKELTLKEQTEVLNNIVQKNIGYSNKIPLSEMKSALLIKPYTKDSELEDLLNRHLGEIGLTMEGLKALHYNRNLLQDSEVSYSEIDEKYGPPLDEGKSLFHMIGEQNQENRKYISTDGSEEYVFYKNIKGEYKLVTNPVNYGTYNISSINKRILTQEWIDGLYWHTILDVIPWILWGNSIEDSTNSIFRKRAYYWGALSQYWIVLKGEVSGLGITQDDAEKNLKLVLQNCQCDSENYEGDDRIVLPKPTPTTPTPPPVVVVPPVTPPTPVADNRYRGFVSGKVGPGGLFTRNANTLDYGKTPLTNGLNTITASDITPDIQIGVTSNSYDSAGGNYGGGSYQYTAWGDWDGNGHTIPGFPTSQIDRGQWVIGRVTTPAEYGQRTGSATFKGDMRGISFNGDTITGDINLYTNFNTDRLNGNISLRSPTGNWVSGVIPTTTITTRSNRVTFDGNLTINGGGSGDIGGVFTGPNAQEMAGQWAIWNVPDSIGGADGVFRAREQ